jgi:hypothetical protein
MYQGEEFFVCSKSGYYMDNYPSCYVPMPTTQYWGSANPELGFFHVEVEGLVAV